MGSGSTAIFCVVIIEHTLVNERHTPLARTWVAKAGKPDGVGARGMKLGGMVSYTCHPVVFLCFEATAEIALVRFYII